MKGDAVTLVRSSSKESEGAEGIYSGLFQASLADCLILYQTKVWTFDPDHGSKMSVVELCCVLINPWSWSYCGNQCFSDFLHCVLPQKIVGSPSTTIMTDVKMQYHRPYLLKSMWILWQAALATRLPRVGQPTLLTSGLLVSLQPKDTLAEKKGSRGRVKPKKCGSWLVRRDWNSQRSVCLLGKRQVIIPVVFRPLILFLTNILLSQFEFNL